MSPAHAEAVARTAPATSPRPRPAPVRPADAPPGRLHRIAGRVAGPVAGRVAELRRGNQLGRVGWLAAGTLFASVFGVVIFQTLIVQGQARLDNLASRTAVQEQRAKDLHHEVADLEAPERIVDAARTRLGMVSPADVAYLRPSAEDDAGAAYVAPPPTTPPASSTGKSSSTKSSGTKSSSTKSSGTSTTPTTTAKTTTTTTKSPTTTTTTPKKPAKAPTP